jgi:hypothetical protein
LSQGLGDQWKDEVAENQGLPRLRGQRKHWCIGQNNSMTSRRKCAIYFLWDQGTNPCPILLALSNYGGKFAIDGCHSY